MDQEKNKAVFRQFSRSDELLSALGEKAAIFLASIGSDISLVVADDGRVVDLAYRGPEMVGANCDQWVGKNLREIVTQESLVKVEALLEDSTRQSITRRRQVNHPVRNAADLPVDYLVISFPGVSHRIFLGNDLRQMATLQRQLVQFQMELEGEYRRIRETEARYRTLFHMTGEPVVVAGEAELRVLDANPAAAAIIGKASRKMIGENVANIFDKPSREAAMAKLQEVRHSGAPQAFAVRFAGAKADRIVHVEPYRESGRSNLVIRIAAEAQHEGKPAVAGAASLPLDLVAEAMVVTDAAGNVESANDLFLDMVNCQNLGQVAGRHLHNWVGGSSVDLQVLMSRLREEQHVRGFATLIRDEIGIDSTVVVSAARRKGADGRERYSFIITDAARRQPSLPAPASQHIREMGDFSELVGRVPLKELIREAADVIEVMCIEAALRQTDNNRASASELLGLSRQSLYLKLKRYGLADFGSDN